MRLALSYKSAVCKREMLETLERIAQLTEIEGRIEQMLEEQFDSQWRKIRKSGAGK